MSRTRRDELVDRSMIETLREHDPSGRRTEALADLRRALVVLCDQVCGSELTNPDKLTVLYLIANYRETRPTAETLLARHRSLEEIGDAPLWSTHARQFISL